MPKNPRQSRALSLAQKTAKISLEIEQAVKNKDLPHIYFNGFSNTITNSDMLLVFKQNDTPVAVLNASYTVAKTLAIKLGNMIAELEERTGNKIMTTDDIEAKIRSVEQDE